MNSNHTIPLLLILLIVVSLPACAQLFSEEDLCQHHEETESKMNQLIDSIIEANAEDSLFLGSFRRAQAAWLEFRIQHLNAIYPEEDKRYYGSAYPMCRCGVLATLTEQRIEQLELWVEGVEEGDACAGSIPFRELEEDENQ